MKNKVKVLFVDIETAPILGYVWGLFEQNVGLNQIKADWHVLSWSAKWMDETKVMYMDQRNSKNIEDDKKILKELWKLLDEAHVVVGQNSQSFDVKKLNARFVIHGFQPPSSFRQIDTLRIARKHFAFTSNKLEYMSSKLCTKYKKLKPKKFPGFEMWRQCMAGNRAAWEEMKEYNKHDVLATEELFYKLIPWDNSINFDVYHDSSELTCKCGKPRFVKNGFFYSNNAKYQRFRCESCGSETRSKQNLLSKEKKKSLRAKTR